MRLRYCAASAAPHAGKMLLRLNVSGPGVRMSGLPVARTVFVTRTATLDARKERLSVV